MSRRTIAIAAALSVLALGSPLITVNANPLARQYFNQGVEKIEEGNYQVAIADFTEVIEINPQYAYVYYWRGVARELVKDLAGTCSDCRKAADFGLKESAHCVKNHCLGLAL